MSGTYQWKIKFSPNASKQAQEITLKPFKTSPPRCLF